MQREVYVSITGLRVRRFWRIPSFWLLAAKAMAQARRAPGSISADARTIGGVHHTRSVWTDKAAMQAYLSKGPHLEAMRRFPTIATGKTIGFLTTDVPSWAQVHTIWVEKGREVWGSAPGVRASFGAAPSKTDSGPPKPLANVSGCNLSKNI